MKPNRVYDNILEGIGDEFLIDCVEFDLMDDILRIVTVFADSAIRYLSTIYNDAWLRKKNFLV